MNAAASPVDARATEAPPLPPSHDTPVPAPSLVRRAGRWLLRLGMIGFLPCCLAGTAPRNICFGIAVAGAVLCRPPLRHLTGLAWGLAFAAWVAFTADVAACWGPVTQPMKGAGLAYTWSVLLLAQLAYAEATTRRWAVRALLATCIASVVLAAIQVGFNLGGAGALHLHHQLRPVEHGTGFQNLHISQGVVLMLAALLFAAAGPLGLLPRQAGAAGGLLATLGVVLATARLAYCGLAAGSIALVGLRSRRAMLAVLAVVAGVGGVVLAVLLVWQHDRTLRALHGDDGRWLIWRTSAAIVQAHPLVGTGGPEGFKAAYNLTFVQVNRGKTNEFPEGAPHAHNSLLSIAAEHGLPAVVLYLGVLAAVLHRLFRSRATAPEAWRLGCAVVSAVLVAGLFENLAGHAAPADMQFACLGLCLACAADPSLRADASA